MRYEFDVLLRKYERELDPEGPSEVRCRPAVEADDPTEARRDIIHRSMASGWAVAEIESVGAR